MEAFLKIDTYNENIFGENKNRKTTVAINIWLTKFAPPYVLKFWSKKQNKKFADKMVRVLIVLNSIFSKLLKNINGKTWNRLYRQPKKQNKML